MKYVVWILGSLLFACFAMADSSLPVNTDGPLVCEKPATGGTVPSGAVQLFQRYISPIDGDRCPMHPSCSAYSRDAFEKHGLLMGWFMTCDRLLRCGRDEWQVSPRVVINGELRCYDSVEQNDFWWTK